MHIVTVFFLIEIRVVERLTGLSVDGVQDILAFLSLCVSVHQILHVLIGVGSKLLQWILGAAECIRLEDRLVVVIEVGVDLGVDRGVPSLLDLLKFEQGFLLLLLKDVVTLVLEDFFDVGERPGNDFDEEIVHDISIISLVRISSWSSVGCKQYNTCIQLWSIFVLFLLSHLFASLIFILVVGELSRFVVLEKDIDVVVEFDVHLDAVEDVEVTGALFDISTLVRYRALS